MQEPKHPQDEKIEMLNWSTWSNQLQRTERKSASDTEETPPIFQTNDGMLQQTSWAKTNNSKVVVAERQRKVSTW